MGIGEEAFAGCEALQDIYINGNVKQIGRRTLADCPFLEESEFARNYAQENDFVYADMERVREEGNLVW